MSVLRRLPTAGGGIADISAPRPSKAQVVGSGIALLVAVRMV